MTRRILLTSTAMLLASLPRAPAADPPQKSLPLPGRVFQVEGHTAFVIPPANTPTNRSVPWVWYAPTLSGLPGDAEKWMFERFTAAGFAIAGIDVGESYGSPAGRALYSALYNELIRQHNFAPKAVMLGRSRGGLMTLSWAADNPDKVAAFAGIYPVCNIASYPGIEKAAGAYQLTPPELDAQLKTHNPIDRLAPLAQAGIPLFAIHGDVDATVPLELNSGLVQDRYRSLGGSMQLIVPAGQGHNMWSGFFQSQELVDFVKEHAGPTITLSSPLNYQVVQRSSKRKGSLAIQGELAGVHAKKPRVEARLVVDNKPGKWRRLSLDSNRCTFNARWNVPAGGWYRLEVRARSASEAIAESVVEHVGVGEVFVIAGQSNSANHGAEKQQTKSGLVAAFDGQRWRLANDPQPGASGEGGSFMPPFGDAIAEGFHVPVGFVACGVGATSVREWLPKGTTFPNPPTLTNNVEQLSNGGRSTVDSGQSKRRSPSTVPPSTVHRPPSEWASKGSIFSNFTARMKQLGPHGFRAVLWHQGESDANQRDPTRTLAGNLYRDYLEQLIRASRREIGWNAPWFVAQASYHVPGDEASPDIRAAQASLWKDGIALQGPDTDALKSNWRDNDGQGVHFDGPGLREHARLWLEKVLPWLAAQTK